MCHVGSFGPQLTTFGRDFKLNGYTMGEVKNRLQQISAMAFAGFEHTQDDVAQTGSLARFKNNDNIEVDQISLFYAGELLPHVGILGQATYNGVADQLAWDNTDIRYANNMTLSGKNFIYGVTANNNPSVQDLWQTTPAWKFPFVGSALAPTPEAGGPYMGSLGGTVGGVGVYSMWNDLLYTEISDYASLPDKVQSTVGEHDISTSDHLTGFDPYWRVALQHTFGQQYASIGTFGMDSERYPGNVRTNGTDKILDTALDATYQFTSADNKHNLSLYGSALHEHQDLSASHALGNATNSTDTLDFYNASASYYYKNTYGVTVSRFAVTGSSDAAIYGAPNGDSATNSPNSAGWTVQLDATPFGTEKSLGWPYLNARFFVQYTAYDKFDGASTNYDGAGTNAADNNTWFTGVWFAF